MDLAALNKVAERHGRAGQGHPCRRRDHRNHQEALRRHRRGIDRGATAATIARCCSASKDAMSNHISGVILYDETIRQKAKDGTPLVKLIAASRRHARHQGRQGRQAAAVLRRRDGHRGSRRPARAACRILRARRALRQMARRDRHRRRTCRATPASRPMPMRWRAMPRSARTPESCRSSSRKC